MLLALHARRSAPSIAAWAAAYPDSPLVVALTGTDLYRDIHSSSAAQQSLHSASRLIVLQDQAATELPPGLRHKCRVVFQSTSARRTLPKTTQHLRAVMVGHLRDEKWPQTLFEAARLLAPEEGILIDHVGVALDPALGALAQATAAACPITAGWVGCPMQQPAAAFSARMCWCTPVAWKAAVTPSWRPCAVARPCWRRACRAMWACWGSTTPGITRRAMRRRWWRCCARVGGVMRALGALGALGALETLAASWRHCKHNARCGVRSLPRRLSDLPSWR